MTTRIRCVHQFEHAGRVRVALFTRGPFATYVAADFAREWIAEYGITAAVVYLEGQFIDEKGLAS